MLRAGSSSVLLAMGARATSVAPLPLLHRSRKTGGWRHSSPVLQRSAQEGGWAARRLCCKAARRPEAGAARRRCCNAPRRRCCVGAYFHTVQVALERHPGLPWSAARSLELRWGWNGLRRGCNEAFAGATMKLRRRRRAWCCHGAPPGVHWSSARSLELRWGRNGLRRGCNEASPETSRSVLPWSSPPVAPGAALQRSPAVPVPRCRRRRYHGGLLCCCATSVFRGDVGC